MHNTRALRVIRGASAASIATLAALLTHVAGGGAMPSGLGIVTAWMATVLVCTALAGRRISLVRLAIAVVFSQVVFHALFVFGAVGTGGLDTGGHAHHHHMMMLPALPADTMAALQADATMWLWHGLAAVVTTAAIHRGERVVARLGALAADVAAWTRTALARRIATPPMLPTLAAPQTPAGAEFRVLTAPFTTALRRRGPPELLAR